LTVQSVELNDQFNSHPNITFLHIIWADRKYVESWKASAPKKLSRESGTDECKKKLMKGARAHLMGEGGDFPHLRPHSL
jgi:hypothetical protein